MPGPPAPCEERKHTQQLARCSGVPIAILLVLAFLMPRAWPDDDRNGPGFPESSSWAHRAELTDAKKGVAVHRATLGHYPENEADSPAIDGLPFFHFGRLYLKGGTNDSGSVVSSLASHRPRINNSMVLESLWTAINQLVEGGLAASTPLALVEPYRVGPLFLASGMLAGSYRGLPFAEGRMAREDAPVDGWTTGFYLDAGSELIAAALAYDSTAHEAPAFARRLDRFAADFLTVVGEQTPKNVDLLIQLLERLHEVVLTGGYCRQATNPIVVHRIGRFNCVSATIVFVEVCRRLRWHTAPIGRPGHVACVVSTSGRFWFVEPTLRPSVWSEAIRPAGVVPHVTTGEELHGSLVSPLFPDEWQVLTPSELVGTVYFNRAVDLLAVGEFAAACRAQLVAVWLSPRSAASWENLVGILNNWAVNEVRAGRLARARKLLQWGQLIAPNDPTLGENWRRLGEWYDSSYYPGAKCP